MGYYIVPDIKDEKVVCQNACEHRDCKANREEWSGTKCVDCGKVLAPGMLFYYKQTTPKPIHQCVDCAFKEIERRIR